jgi:hypothetical protein
MATILLIIGALITAPFSTLIAGDSSILVGIGIGANIVFNAAIIWLGFALFSGRSVATEQTFNEE